MELTFTTFDDDFLSVSWKWLQDEELCKLLNISPVTMSQQQEWFGNLKKRIDYSIWGISFERQRIGACGLKNITLTEAEYWGYIGDRNYWGRGIGSSILQFVEKESTARRLEKLYLRVLKLNKVAINLYHKHDFIIKSETSTMFIMEKKLGNLNF